jgi:hypothetical protein
MFPKRRPARLGLAGVEVDIVEGAGDVLNRDVFQLRFEGREDDICRISIETGKRCDEVGW